ncbi:putative effector protein/Pectinesterase [Ceratobasidium theobromae]|uniref:pectinesterase n=1 Tax=Ceratobasidium theobromae TaxID=1582974 RepID=A0A5N5QCT3_9AGAM|nr:putative effector protein/Pectinesterase [Ceratobasidium theobromae]
MWMFVPIALIIGLVSSTFAFSSPPPNSITVGNGGKYSTLREALKDKSSDVYFVFKGNYIGQTVITRPNIKIYGQSYHSLEYSSNTVNFTNTLPAKFGHDAESATIRVLAPGVSFYNLIIENKYGNAASHLPAVALSVEAGKFGCYACQIKGYQDTLLADRGPQYYGKCLIEGGVDFIFGQFASVFINKSTIKSIGHQSAIVASGRSSDDSNYYVINASSVEAIDETYLGRPWQDYARVIYQYCYLDAHIPPAGWKVWTKNDTNIEHVLFGEHDNHGPGAWRDGRVKFATKLSYGTSINTVLGSTDWVDSLFM